MKDNYYSGFEMEQHIHPLQGGRKIIYVRVGLEKENGHFRNQTKDHYLTTCLLAGELSRMGADVKTDDYGTGQLADVVAKFTIKQPDDSVLIKNIAFEYERKDSHTKEQLIEKRERLLAKEQDGKPVFNAVIFFADWEYYPELREAVGADFAVQRGKKLKAKIDELLVQRTENPPVLIPMIEEQNHDNTDCAVVL